MSYKKYLKNKIQKNPKLKENIGFWSWLIEVGAKIAERRKVLGYSQAVFADKMGISQTVIARIETGQNMKCSTLWGISSILKEDLELFGISKNMEMEKFEKFYNLNISQNTLETEIFFINNLATQRETFSGSNSINWLQPIHEPIIL